jgi:hypothetical protein
MRKQRIEAAEKVAEKLFEAENAVDQAIIRAAELTASIPTARTEAGLSAVVGQNALDEVVKTLPALVAGRKALIETHNQLDRTKTEIGLREVAFGTPNGKPPAHTILRAVEDAA